MTFALFGFAALVIFCLLGFKVGFATLLVGLLGYTIIRSGTAALTVVGQQFVHDAMNYNLSVIPLFVLMGAFIYHSDVGSDLFTSAQKLFGRFRGGLAMSTVVASGGFSAVCGSTLATAATMAKVAMPPMRRYRYSDRLAAGTVAAGGTLGIMIPPSVPLLLFGIIAEQDIGRLFIAGVVPGLLLLMLFIVAVAISVRLFPGSNPSQEETQADAGTEAAQMRGGGALPILILFLVVLGGIYGGVFTAVEAAGIGSVGAAVIALSRGYLRTLDEWRVCLVEASLTTAKLFIVLFGALVFAQFINVSGLPVDLLRFVAEHALPGWQLVLFIIVIALLMGMAFEAIGILVLLVPIFLPALQATGVDLIWFGIIVVLVVEIGLLTPPIGMNVFVVKSVVRQVAVRDIFMGVMPFLAALVLALVLVFLMPQLATFLPNLMR